MGEDFLKNYISHYQCITTAHITINNLLYRLFVYIFTNY